jgi:hypothetical protein
MRRQGRVSIVPLQGKGARGIARAIFEAASPATDLVLLMFDQLRPLVELLMYSINHVMIQNGTCVHEFSNHL